MRKVLILILCFSFNGILPANTEITREQWERSIEKVDYAEDYKEFKQRDKKNTDSAIRKPERNSRANNLSFLPKAITILVILLLLALLVVILINNIAGARLARKIKDKTAGSIEELEDPDQIAMSELDKFLLEAIQSKDYRLAVRVQFLITMKSLKEKEYINWKKEKTNFDYLLELSKHEFFELFRKLVVTFEKIWYAEYQPDQLQFEKISLGFNDLRSKIEQ